MNQNSPFGVNYHTPSNPHINSYHLFYQPHEKQLSDFQIKSEMKVIKDELYCNAVRVIGYTSQELIRVGKIVKKSGLTPWYSPRFIGATFEKTIEELIKFVKYAVAEHADIQNCPLVVANELPYDCADNSGKYIESYQERINYYVDYFLKKGNRINNTNNVTKLIQEARNTGWTGEITYASILDEIIDWATINDSKLIVSSNLYWGTDYKLNKPWTDKEYENKILKLKFQAGIRKVVITEFGTVPQSGAFEKGGGAYTLQGPLNYESQKKAYERYLAILNKCDVGYFAYAFSEPKPNRPQVNFGIAIPDKNGVASIITPAGKILSQYNKKHV